MGPGRVAAGQNDFMLKRIYADNFRCFTNFELRLDRLNLLLGENGSGKTSVFELLHRLQRFLGGEAKVRDVFPSGDLTRWQEDATQRFEISIAADGGEFAYALVIEHDAERRNARVHREALSLDGQPLFEFKEGTVRLFHDDSSRGPEYPFDWTQSGLAVLNPRADNKKLTRFRQAVKKIIVAGIHPMLMRSESREEAAQLSRHMENFTSWYRFASAEHQGATFAAFLELAQVLPGFQSFSLKEAGEAKLLKVLMKSPAAPGREQFLFDFDELSDGQKVLAALYCVLFVLRDQGGSLFLDEPDNFVTLREIQPWFTGLQDLIGDGWEQAVLISHHPGIIDRVPASAVRWFEREPNGHTVVSDGAKLQIPGLTSAEAMARGWTQ